MNKRNLRITDLVTVIALAILLLCITAHCLVSCYRARYETVKWVMAHRHPISPMDSE